MPNQSVTINQGQNKTVTAMPRQGINPGTINGAPTWQSVSGNVTVTPATDGLSAVVAVASVPGTYQVNVTGQGIPSGPTFTTPFDVVVPPGVADHFEFSFI